MIHSVMDDTQRYLFHQGNNAYAYRFMGAHPESRDGEEGYRFAVWAPNAQRVSVVGSFNEWDFTRHPLQNESGIWTGWAPAKTLDSYKYAIQSQTGEWNLKADPYAFHAETRPYTASKAIDLEGYVWEDQDWMRRRAAYTPYVRPMNIYELHIGSWKRNGAHFLDYEALAEELIPYVTEMGYTHIQLLPVMEHPLDMSWGYQVTGYFAPTSRYGMPHGFMRFVDRCHQAGIGVFLDWVPAHFPRDGHGLRRFDGSALYEHEDPRRGDHPQWGTHIFNYGRTEVQSFLISSAVFWLDMYHIDGLRVDAVSSMLYLDFCREAGQWLPNQYGGRENIEAIQFLRRLNELVYQEFAGVVMTAEESSAYPMVTQPTYLGGLGFGFKWNMGWMNDMLAYVKTDSIYRKWAHEKLTFSMMYAFSENYILPLSHDEVVHGKASLLNRCFGDYWQKFACLRTLYGYMYAHPGKKLLFMGGEFGQFIEWKYDDELDWFLLEYPQHDAMREYVKALNHFYRENSPLWQRDGGWDGFQWLNANDHENSIASFLRIDDAGETLAVVSNFTPSFWPEYRIGVPQPGTLTECFNSDEARWGGSGKGNGLPIRAEDTPWDGHPYSIVVTIPPLSTIMLRYAREALPKAQNDAPRVGPGASPQGPRGGAMRELEDRRKEESQRKKTEERTK